MKLLMIDTSGIVASAAVMEEHKLIGEIIINYQKKHSEKLLPAIDHLLADTGLTIQKIDAFGVVKGPGSFTGLRIGMATVKGFAQALNKPVIGISTLEALAANLLLADGLICPMIDARRGQVFTAVYQNRSGEIEVILPEQLIDIETLTEKLTPNRNRSIYLLGEGAALYEQTITERLSNVRKIPPYLKMNRASSAAHLAMKKLLKGEAENHFTIEPFYMRPSYAEEN